MKKASIPYRRILLKVSGEMLRGPQQESIHGDSCCRLAQGIKELQNAGIEVGVVIGGGNLFRGIQAHQFKMDRTPADQIGMLATVMNGIALQQALKAENCPAKVMSALDCPKVVSSYQWNDAMKSLSEGEVVVFTGGTGNPYFSTDSAAALRACEIHANLLLKATKVDGVYSQDPLKFPKAKKFQHLSYTQVLAEKLEVMDATSVAMCMKSEIPIFVFHMQWLEPKKILSLFSKKEAGTWIDSKG